MKTKPDADLKYIKIILPLIKASMVTPAGNESIGKT